jgi:hypothetical protein
MQNDGPVQRRVQRRSVLPPELQGWNWGAFFLNWVWGLAHNTWIALLMFVPGVNIIMPFVLGAKGNAWAWANNDWRDVEHFKRTQRIWARVGVATFVGVPLFFVLIFAMIMMGLNSSDPYRITVETLRDHPQLERSLGFPVQPSGWWTTGNIELHNSEGIAELAFDIEGPKGSGTASAHLRKDQDQGWTLHQLNVLTEDGERIVLVITEGI